jgi:four helix bundle protein
MNSEELMDRLIDFGARSIRAGFAMPKNEICKHVALQLVRSATSAGANYAEACGAESKRDFTHKLQIVVKELREAQYWLRLIVRAQLLPPKRLQGLLTEADELLAISVASSRTARQRQA